METKSLLFGLIGFFVGGLIVSVAATTFDGSNTTTGEDMTMNQMAESLKGKQDDEFDKAFMAEMIVHHQGAVDMAKLAENNAKHDEIKKMSREIIAAQEAEIEEMKQWQIDWGYSTSPDSMHSMHGM
jgi:uncharacterized protein (DUF305 family)